MSIEVGKHTFTPHDPASAYPHDHADPDQIRIAAFGAIRRAAEVMRWHEANAKRLERLRPDGLNEYEAQAIRRAIRAAIGSPKA